MVEVPNAVVDPRAMVIHLEDASAEGACKPWRASLQQRRRPSNQHTTRNKEWAASLYRLQMLQ